MALLKFSRERSILHGSSFDQHGSRNHAHHKPCESNEIDNCTRVFRQLWKNSEIASTQIPHALSQERNQCAESHSGDLPRESNNFAHRGALLQKRSKIAESHSGDLPRERNNLAESHSGDLPREDKKTLQLQSSESNHPIYKLTLVSH